MRISAIPALRSEGSDPAARDDRSSSALNRSRRNARRGAGIEFSLLHALPRTYLKKRYQTRAFLYASLRIVPLPSVGASQENTG